MDPASTPSNEGIICVVAGLNASGKTRLLEKIRREHHDGTVRYVAFCDTYGTATDRSYYLQQRWNQHDIDEETPTVGQALERSFLLAGSDTPERRQYQQWLYTLLEIDGELDKYVIALSSGELRKMQLAKTLMAQPRTLILDNPFIGLDSDARHLLSDLLLRLKQQGVRLYLAVARPNEIPPFADELIRTSTEEEFGTAIAPTATDTNTASPLPTIPVAQEENDSSAPEIISMKEVSISYGQRIILKPLTWTVRQGEHWALTGRNGSGKSTLLSLVCADNPQSYACDIALFGHQRGTGETIWEIKKRIGYVSPELHRSYQRNLPTLSIVASGLKDTVGLYTHYDEQERLQCLQWMHTFGIEQLADRSFLQLSSGEQRLALVCRAFVKSPSLLILDEPMHGLDLHRQQQLKNIINSYCTDPKKTLIMVTHYEEELPACIDHRLCLS